MKHLQWILLWAAAATFMAFAPAKKKKIPAPPTFAYVPSGTLWEIMPDGKHKEPKKRELTHLQGFFMKEHEVTNKEYRAFLADLKQQGRTQDWAEAMPDTLVWQSEDGLNQPFVGTYFRHPAYDEYPVVGLSHKAAKIYCEWLGQQWKANLQERKKALRGLEFDFRLPTKHQWMHAARGGDETAIFPWNGAYTRNDKGKILANFKHVPDYAIKYDQEKQEYDIREERMGLQSHITAPAKSYAPNGYGLYNMSGNLSEWLEDGGTKGGCYASSGYYMQIDAEEEFPSLSGEASKYVGFRPVAVIMAKEVTPAHK